MQVEHTDVALIWELSVSIDPVLQAAHSGDAAGIKGLTPAEQRYLERAGEADQHGLTLEQYYRSSGLSLSWLHKVCRRLRRKGVVTPEGIALRPVVARGEQFVQARMAALLAMKSIKATDAGPLAQHLEGFVAHLVREGYCDSALYAKCALARELDCWLVRHNLALIDIHEASLQQFQAVRRRQCATMARRSFHALNNF